MAITTANMGLTAWNLNTDPYNHLELKNNFVAIDSHDHAAGNGVQIPTGGIALAAVTSAKIADGSITSAKIAANAVGQGQLDATYVHPLGTVVAWWRPSNSVPVPTGWVIPSGQTLSTTQHDFGTGGSIHLPDLRNAFILGAATSNTGPGTDFPPAIGDTGGSHLASYSHTHAVNGHTHTVSGHSHTVNSHAHQVSDHDHGAGTLDMDKAAVRDQQLKTDNAGAQRANTVGGPGDDGHKHDMRGRTGSSSPMTDSRTPGTDSIGLTTNSSTATTDQGLGVRDIRPNFVGLLYIMKVRL